MLRNWSILYLVLRCFGHVDVCNKNDTSTSIVDHVDNDFV